MKLSQQIREMDMKSKIMAGLALIALLGTVAIDALRLSFSLSFATYIPGALLIVYALSWCRGVSKNQMAAFTYGVMAAYCLANAFSHYGRYYGYWLVPVVMAPGISAVVLLLAAVAFALAVVLAMRGKSCMPAALGACVLMAGFVLLGSLLYAVPTVMLYGALFMLSITPDRRVVGSDVQSAEQKLNLLKEKHELGILTDEQYQAQRQEILMNM